MNLLFFHLEVDFSESIILIANNEVDLENELIELGFTDIYFSYLKNDYGTCSLKDKFGNSEVAKCFYVKKI